MVIRHTAEGWRVAATAMVNKRPKIFYHLSSMLFEFWVMDYWTRFNSWKMAEMALFWYRFRWRSIFWNSSVSNSEHITQHSSLHMPAITSIINFIYLQKIFAFVAAKLNKSQFTSSVCHFESIPRIKILPSINRCAHDTHMHCRLSLLLKLMLLSPSRSEQKRQIV